MTLEKYGWNDFFEQYYREHEKKGFKAARVISENKAHYRLLTTDGELPARVAGRLFHTSTGKSDLPVVGDWVIYKVPPGPEPLGRIHHALPRKSLFSRKIPGRVTREQPVAANIDTIFLITGLDDNFNLRRIERYLALAWESGAYPVVLLNKMDICPESQKRLEQTLEVAAAVPVYVISALQENGLDQLGQYLQEGRTVAMLGSSGVGKSTLLNTLHGKKLQRVDEIGVIGKGKHTTRLQELFLLPSGAMLIDTPGMREIQLWNVDDGMADSFPDIEELALECRFSDCHHISEPDCAVRMAVDQGYLDAKRYDNYLRLRRELEELESRQDRKAMLQKKAEIKSFHKHIKQVKKTHQKYQK